MPAHARTVVFTGLDHPLAVRAVAIPKLGPGEILIRVTHATICGSDLHSFTGRRLVPVPTVLGHEIVGHISELGGGDAPCDLHGDPLREGDRVTWGVVAHCGQCFSCQRDVPQKCERAVKYGHEPLAPGKELRGGLAEYCLLAPGTSVVRLPTSLANEMACPASCATATAAAACEAVGTMRGRRVLIVGAGLLGLTACAMATEAGAEQVLVCDPDSARLALAAACGATDVALPEQLGERVAQATQQRGVDCVLEMSGAPWALTTALDTSRVGATIVLIGSVFPQPPEAISAERLVRQHITVRGVHNYAPRHLLTAVEFLARQPAARWDRVVGRWFDLADAESAFHWAIAERPLRVGVRP